MVTEINNQNQPVTVFKIANKLSHENVPQVKIFVMNNDNTDNFI